MELSGGHCPVLVPTAHLSKPDNDIKNAKEWHTSNFSPLLKFYTNSKIILFGHLSNHEK
jgi:hypothetical protein